MQRSDRFVKRDVSNRTGATVAFLTILMLLPVIGTQGQRAAPQDQEQQKQIAGLKAHPKQLNKYDSHGYTPLMRAAQSGELLVVRYLLRHGAHVDLLDHTDALQDEHNTAVGMAIMRENYDVAAELIRWGANINASLGGITITSDMSDPVPLLSMAARDGDLKMIRFLATHGAKLDVVDYQGHVPLFYSENVAVAKALIGYGAHVNPRIKGNDALLDDALKSMPRDIGPQFYVPDDIIVVFLKAGATSPDAMCLAASRRTIGPLQQMLNQGWNPDRRNRAGLTPLMVAASERRPDVVRLLLSHKAQVDLRSPKGQTALKLARNSTGHREYDNVNLPEPSEPPANKESWQEVIRLLQAAGAKE